MMQKSTMYFQYDFSCKKVLLHSILCVKKCHFHYDMQNKNYQNSKGFFLSTVHPHMIHVITKRSHTFPTNITHMRLCLWTCRLYPLLVF
jgi:hypothetical protein